MTRLYKLTSKDDQTFGWFQWGEGVTAETSGEGDLCGPGFTHWYTNPLLAVLLNPIHGNYNLDTAHLWEGEGEIVKDDRGLKVGCVKATTIKRIPLPKVTLEECVTFAIKCALAVYRDKTFLVWAENWLNNTDRSYESAFATAATCRASSILYCTAAVHAAAAANAAAHAAAACHASSILYYTAANDAAAAANRTSLIVHYTAAAADDAANAAANADTSLNLVDIAQSILSH